MTDWHMQWEFLSDPEMISVMYSLYILKLAGGHDQDSLCVPCSMNIHFRKAKTSSLFCNYVWFLADFVFPSAPERESETVEDAVDAVGTDLLRSGKNSWFYILNCN